MTTKKYRILKPVILGFLTAQDQYDLKISPGDGETLESDGRTIWTIKNGVLKDSTTPAINIFLWVAGGRIAEIKE